MRHAPVKTSAQFAVLTVLALHANEHGACWPSLRTIARMVGSPVAAHSGLWLN